MKMYSRRKGQNKGTESKVPNVLVFTVIRNFLTDKSYEEMRKGYFINNLSGNQVNQAMKDIKWLFEEYKGLDVITMENLSGEISKCIL